MEGHAETWFGMLTQETGEKKREEKGNKSTFLKAYSNVP